MVYGTLGGGRDRSLSTSRQFAKGQRALMLRLENGRRTPTGDTDGLSTGVLAPWSLRPLPGFAPLPVNCLKQ